jgi:hypothetical protein
MPSNAADIPCLFSHKCCAESHEVGLAMERQLLKDGIALKIDPFNIGDNVEIRMQTFEIEALVFLYSPESYASPYVQMELQCARRQRFPHFVVHAIAQVPAQLRRFIDLKLPPLGSSAFEKACAELADAIQNRVQFRRKLRMLHPSKSFHELIEVAQEIALDGDRTLIAESACDLSLKYCKISDPTTCYWIALALGRADTPRAARLLNRLPKKDHPLVSQGIREAKDMLRHNTSPN